MKHLDQFSYTEVMPVLSTEGMRALDKAAKEALAKDVRQTDAQIEGETRAAIEAGYELMKQAGAALFQKVVEVLDAYRGDVYRGSGNAPETQIRTAPRSVAVFVGGGNNGGDGLVLAKLLIEAGIPCTTYSLAAASKFQNEAKMALEDFAQAGGRLVMSSPVPESLSQAETALESLPQAETARRMPRFAGFTLAVDCMLGNGAHGELRELYAAAVRDIAASNIPVVAADAPTGYDSQEHVRREPCTRACETLLFGFPRLDAYTREGGPIFGEASVAPLGYPASTVAQFNENTFLATESLIPQILPERDDWGDKRKQGCAMIVAGSGDMPGAAALCTQAALRSGAGLATLASPEAVMPVLQAKLSEPVFVNLQDIAGQDADSTDDRATALSPAHIPQILEKAKHNQALAIGPGIGCAECTRDAVIEILPQLSCPLVIDADALNAIATLNKTSASPTSGAASYLHSIETAAILTPHRREFERLFGALPTNDIDIPKLLRDIARNTKKVILLKGTPTFVAVPDGRVFVIPAHNSGLAKGGSGDVLTGIITALLAQGLPTAESAVLGALLHQKAGRIAREKIGAFSMLPSDVIDALPQAFGR
ncbi:NAD(P)H-hydrate epimerase [Fibrobacter sp. UWT3]|uniref:NAD(P)H-hydrate dehydratase n=1 Tax=Fibrobacter sp. UWT3 TaxID=1896225 RepID=UPI000BCAA3F2|nr:NAD(P)H-hydrate dehydratase [Fibrobacter sp. UWT3]SOE79383.1 NAD(P)H-hydrate epimerase [Fibrobacter sp. UWT3]